MQYFTILQYKLHSLNIQDDGMHAWAFSETVKKNFQNHPYGQPVLNNFDKRQMNEQL